MEDKEFNEMLDDFRRGKFSVSTEKLKEWLDHCCADRLSFWKGSKLDNHAIPSQDLKSGLFM
jgi:hypothetical protein